MAENSDKRKEIELSEEKKPCDVSESADQLIMTSSECEEKRVQMTSLLEEQKADLGILRSISAGEEEVTVKAADAKPLYRSPRPETLSSLDQQKAGLKVSEIEEEVADAYGSRRRETLSSLDQQKAGLKVSEIEEEVSSLEQQKADLKVSEIVEEVTDSKPLYPSPRPETLSSLDQEKSDLNLSEIEEEVNSLEQQKADLKVSEIEEEVSSLEQQKSDLKMPEIEEEVSSLEQKKADFNVSEIEEEVTVNTADAYGSRRRETLLPQLDLSRSRETLLPQLDSYRRRETLLPQLDSYRRRETLLPQLDSYRRRETLLPPLVSSRRPEPHLLHRLLPGIMNPHSKLVQSWNKLLAFSSVISIFIDPLFLILLRIRNDNKCIEIDWPVAKGLVSIKSITDLIFLLNIFLQFRVAYVAPESTLFGAGQMVYHPGKIARHYLRGKFTLDFLIMLPLLEIMTFFMVSLTLGRARTEIRRYLQQAWIICCYILIPCQYILKLCYLLPQLAGRRETGFIFDSAWMNFSISLLTYVLAGHAVGSFWYFAGLQRVKTCLFNAWNISLEEPRHLIDCSLVNSVQPATFQALWRDNPNVETCFEENGFSYGIYKTGVNLTHESNYLTRYCYSLFWGFQQISTLSGTLIPSYSIVEVLFTISTIAIGLLLFARLVGNLHNFLQSLDRRRMDRLLREREVNDWMNRRLFPGDIMRRVKESEKLNWKATRGVNEELLTENMPDDLQRDIKRHLFQSLEKVRIFSLLDESVLDSIRERVKQTTYIRNSMVLNRGGLVRKMVFIVTGKMESVGEDGSVFPLSEGDVCGEEIFSHYMDRSSTNADVTMQQRGLVSKRDVRCVTDVEAFSLSVSDVEDITSLFPRFLSSHQVQGDIRYRSPIWRLSAAMQIQDAWRKKKSREDGSNAAESNSYR